MTLRLSPELDAAVEERAAREGVSKQKVVEAAVAAYTGERRERLHGIARHVVAVDAELLHRLAQ